MTREQKYEAAFNTLLDDYFYTADGVSPCEYCPIYKDPGACPAVFEFDDDVPFADYCVHDDVCRELLLQHYLAKGVGKVAATAAINAETC